MRILSAALLMVSAFSFAQRPQYDFNKAELDARKLVFSKPNEALVIIKNTLTQSNTHDTIKGNTYNLYGLYHNMTGNPDSSIYYFKKAIGYVKPYPRLKAGMIINLSTAYRHKGEYDKAIDILSDAVKEYNKKEDNTARAMMYGELASNYNYKLEYKTSVPYLLKAIDLLEAEGQTDKLPAIKQKLANTYLKMQNYDFAIDLYKECLKDFKAAGAEKNYYLTLVNVGEAQIQIKKLSQAKASLTEAAQGLEKFGDAGLIGITYSKIGNLENRQGNPAAALVAYQKSFDLLVSIKSPKLVRIGAEYIDLLNSMGNHKKALEIIKAVEANKVNDGDNLEDKMMYQKSKANTYSLSGKSELAVEAYQNTVVLKDSVNAKEKENAVQEIQAKFQTELQRERNLALQAKNNALTKKVEAERKMSLLNIIISVVLLVLILFILRSVWLRSRLHKERVKTVEAEKSLIEQQSLYEKELNTAQREKIEEKQRELTSFTLRMANYQDNLTEVINKIDNGEFVKTSDVKKELHSLVKTKDYWKQFETRFNKIHPDFNASLTEKYPNLTKNDMEFCSLLKLNLSNKEIASLLQISHESVITKKYRIKKKMNIQDDSEFEKLLNEL